MPAFKAEFFLSGQVSGKFSIGGSLLLNTMVKCLLLKGLSNTLASFICAFFVYFMIYETKGLSLEQYAVEGLYFLYYSG